MNLSTALYYRWHRGLVILRITIVTRNPIVKSSYANKPIKWRMRWCIWERSRQLLYDKRLSSRGHRNKEEEMYTGLTICYSNPSHPRTTECLKTTRSHKKALGLVSLRRRRLNIAWKTPQEFSTQPSSWHESAKKLLYRKSQYSAR